MKLKTTKKIQTAKLNLIPIMDAVFIFIFFLLTSAQFIKLKKIDINIAATQNNTMEIKKEPLNLQIEIDRNKIKVKTGVTNKNTKIIEISPGNEYLIKLNKYLKVLKNKYPNENSALVSACDSCSYKKIILVTDHVTHTKDIDKHVLFNTLSIE